MQTRTPTSESIQKKLRLMSDLFAFAMRVKTAQLRKKYPEWSSKELRGEAYRLIEHANQ